jgi:hypothetical protein
MQYFDNTLAFFKSTSNGPSPRHRARDLCRPPFPLGGSEAVAVCAELEADHRREIRRLDDLAFSLLRGADGDQIQAENLLEDSIDLLFEGGALSMWRY